MGDSRDISLAGASRLATDSNPGRGVQVIVLGKQNKLWQSCLARFDGCGWEAGFKVYCPSGVIGISLLLQQPGPGFRLRERRDPSKIINIENGFLHLKFWLYKLAAQSWASDFISFCLLFLIYKWAQCL